MKSFTMVAEKQEGEKATIAVTIDGHQGPRPKPVDQTMRYDFVREAGQWKIDDIRGSVDGKPWSVRGMLTASLKYQGLNQIEGPPIPENAGISARIHGE